MDESHHQSPNFTKDEWRHYMKEMISLHVDAPVLTKSWMILKPPQALLEVSPESYYPKLVTIGPLYQNLEPSSINNYKALCVNKFMERHGIAVVEDLMQYLTPYLPDELRHIYSLNLPQSDFEWLQLLVTVDTVFIHEFLLFIWVDSPMETVGYFATFFSNDHTLRLRLLRDLMLIGNQIPMSFLKKIAEFPNNRDFSLADLEMTVRAFIVQRNPFFFSEDVRCRFLGFLESENLKLVDTCEHLLDSLYFSCTVGEEDPTRQTTSHESRRKSDYSCFSFLNKWGSCKKTKKLETHKKEYVRLPTASQLYRAGIRFKACEGNISVMKYDKSKFQLHLPRLVLFNSTEVMLRNLLAHEITSRKQGEFFTYTNIMDMLIDTEEDLAILTKAKIIENHMGNDIRVVQMWTDMGINVLMYDASRRWRDMIPDIITHYSSRWHRLYAECHEKFFSRPWLWISVIAAFLLLSASISQTFYSIAGYYQNT